MIKKRKEERCFPVAGKELSTLRADLQTAYVILKSDLCYGSWSCVFYLENLNWLTWSELWLSFQAWKSLSFTVLGLRLQQLLLKKTKGKIDLVAYGFYGNQLSLLSIDQHKQSKDKCLGRCVWGVGRGVPGGDGGGGGGGVTVINFNASWVRWPIPLLSPPRRAHVYAARGTGKWNWDTFVVQNSLDSRTFVKLKSEIFISQGRMKWENLYLWLMITFFKTVFKLCTTLGRHLYICINSFPWACDQKIVCLIFIVIEKASLYLAFLWSQLFCIFLLAWISYASEKRVVNFWKSQERTTGNRGCGGGGGGGGDISH